MPHHRQQDLTIGAFRGQSTPRPRTLLLVAVGLCISQTKVGLVHHKVITVASLLKTQVHCLI